jgi:hypothetical protein
MLQERLQLGYEMIRQISLHAATGGQLHSQAGSGFQ